MMFSAPEMNWALTLRYLGRGGGGTGGGLVLNPLKYQYKNRKSNDTYQIIA